MEWPAPGTVLAERWRLCDEVIGRGAFSTVVSAMDSTNGDAVAVKLEPMSCTSGSLEREFIILKGELSVRLDVAVGLFTGCFSRRSSNIEICSSRHRDLS